jgi:hypothetical protein
MFTDSLIAPRARRALPLIGLAVVATGVLACGSDKSTGPKGLDGTYALQAVAGQPLPVELQGTASVVIVETGTLTLSREKWTLTIDGTVDGQQSNLITDNGSFSGSGDAIQFSSAPSGDTSHGTLIDGVVTLDYDVNGQAIVELTFAPGSSQASLAAPAPQVGRMGSLVRAPGGAAGFDH